MVMMMMMMMMMMKAGVYIKRRLVVETPMSKSSVELTALLDANSRRNVAGTR